MAFTNFEEFEKAFQDAVDTDEVDCGKIGKLTVREPAAVDFEPIDARRRELIEKAEIDPNCPEDQKLIPDSQKDNPPKFSYLKFSPEDRGAWFANCADIICATVTNGNGELLFKDKRDFVRSWPGGLLTQVSDDITAFVRGGKATENPTTK